MTFDENDNGLENPKKNNIDRKSIEQGISKVTEQIEELNEKITAQETLLRAVSEKVRNQQKIKTTLMQMDLDRKSVELGDLTFIDNALERDDYVKNDLLPLMMNSDISKEEVGSVLSQIQYHVDLIQEGIDKTRNLIDGELYNDDMKILQAKIDKYGSYVKKEVGERKIELIDLRKLEEEKRKASE